MNKKIVELLKKFLSVSENKINFLNGTECLNYLEKYDYLISQSNCLCEESIDVKLTYKNNKSWVSLDVNTISGDFYREDNEFEYEFDSFLKSAHYVSSGKQVNPEEGFAELKKHIPNGKKIRLEYIINTLLFCKNCELYIQNQVMFSYTIQNILSVAQGKLLCTSNCDDLYKQINNKIYKSFFNKDIPSSLSNSLDLIFEADTASLLLHEIVHIFEMENLKPLVGKRIMNEHITIIDTPKLEKSWANRTYDDYGKEIENCVLVESGRICNVGDMINRNLINYGNRKRFMINTVLYNTENKATENVCNGISEGLLFYEILGAKNDGKNIILRRCKFKVISDGRCSKDYFANRIVLKISDVIKKLVPVGNKNYLVNGICSDKYYVSYSAPMLLVKDIEVAIN